MDQVKSMVIVMEQKAVYLLSCIAASVLSASVNTVHDDTTLNVK